jgi:hypothetical protein
MAPREVPTKAMDKVSRMDHKIFPLENTSQFGGSISLTRLKKCGIPSQNSLGLIFRCTTLQPRMRRNRLPGKRQVLYQR